MRISDWSSDVCSSDLDARDIPLYVAAQVLGAIVAAWLLYYIAQGSPAFDIANGLAANGYDAGSPGGYDIWSALIIEIVLTAGFVWVIMGSTDGDRKSVVEGKGVSGRVDIGGRRLIKKKKTDT